MIENVYLFHKLLSFYWHILSLLSSVHIFDYMKIMFICMIFPNFSYVFFLFLHFLFVLVAFAFLARFSLCVLCVFFVVAFVFLFLFDFMKWKTCVSSLWKIKRFLVYLMQTLENRRLVIAEDWTNRPPPPWPTPLPLHLILPTTTRFNNVTI